MDKQRIMISQIKNANCHYENYYRISDFSIRTTKNGKDYASFYINDMSGKMSMKLWDISDTNCINPGLIKEKESAIVTFKTTEYQGSIQGTVERIEGVEPNSIPDLESLIPLAPDTFDFYWFELQNLVNNFSNELLKGIIIQLLNDNKHRLRIPAAKTMHDACVNGLLHHTYRMAKAADCIRDVYPEANWDLVIAGAIAHDIGKVAEFIPDSFGLVKDYSRQGKLLGHQIGGILLLRSSFTRYREGKSFSQEEEALQSEIHDVLSHMIESHHGKPEFGSAIPPKIMEARILNYLDELDAKIVQFGDAESKILPGNFSEGKVFGLDAQIYRPSFK